jgi:hypothetical protein
MKYRFLYYIFIAFFAFSCSYPEQNQEKKEKTTVTESKEKMPEENKQNLRFGTSVDVDNSDLILFTIINEDINQERGYSIKRKKYEYDVWNILFYNIITEEYYTLIKNSGQRIKNFYVNIKSKGEHASKYNFYEIINEDVNEDQKINFEDPVYLFVSGKNGKKLKQISPKGYDVLNWEIAQKSNVLLINALEDTDDNNIYDFSDQEVILKVDLVTLELGKPILKKDFIEELKNM